MLTKVTSIDNHFSHPVNLMHVKTLIKTIARYSCPRYKQLWPEEKYISPLDPEQVAMVCTPQNRCLRI